MPDNTDRLKADILEPKNEVSKYFYQPGHNLSLPHITLRLKYISHA